MLILQRANSDIYVIQPGWQAPLGRSIFLENPTSDVSWGKTVGKIIFQTQIKSYIDGDLSSNFAEIKEDTAFTRQKRLQLILGDFINK